MVKTCSWGLCRSRSDRAPPELQFVPFPKPSVDLSRAKRWVQLCGRSNFDVSNIKKWTYVCSLHFLGTDKLDWKTNPQLEPIAAGLLTAKGKNKKSKAQSVKTVSTTVSPVKVSFSSDNERKNYRKRKISTSSQ